MPGLFATSSQLARPLRGPPKATVAAKTEEVRAAAREAALAAERAGRMLAAMEAVPWPSEVEHGNDPADEAPEVFFGPELPTGDHAVAHLLANARPSELEGRFDALQRQVKAMRAAEPVDPNVGRLSPDKRGAKIVREVEAAIVACPPALDDASRSVPQSRAILQDLVQQEADSSAKFKVIAASAAKLEADMAEFVMYAQSTPYVTQLRAAHATGGPTADAGHNDDDNDDDDDGLPIALPAGARRFLARRTVPAERAAEPVDDELDSAPVAAVPEPLDIDVIDDDGGAPPRIATPHSELDSAPVTAAREPLDITVVGGSVRAPSRSAPWSEPPGVSDGGGMGFFRGTDALASSATEMGATYGGVMRVPVSPAIDASFGDASPPARNSCTRSHDDMPAATLITGARGGWAAHGVGAREREEPEDITDEVVDGTMENAHLPSSFNSFPIMDSTMENEETHVPVELSTCPLDDSSAEVVHTPAADRRRWTDGDGANMARDAPSDCEAGSCSESGSEPDFTAVDIMGGSAPVLSGRGGAGRGW
ncbi:hypothetical protein KFE25_013486 [Diacronema lutheri]|uniref:Uncharacterized protein n=1 Tax=Diacronema lutheri TaxID=2081491 RepID=A0A8J5XNG7_DIALT|nr:hypothetical protein KFE25_013486 [Diacronema lutheri]